MSKRKRLPTEAEHYRIHALVRIMKYCAHEIAHIAFATLPVRVGDLFLTARAFDRLLWKVQNPFDNFAAAEKTIKFADWAMHYSHDLLHSPREAELRAAIENAITECAASVEAGEAGRTKP